MRPPRAGSAGDDGQALNDRGLGGLFRGHEDDHFVLNEAEATLPEFLRDFARRDARRVYAAAEFPDLHQTPAPLWELAEFSPVIVSDPVLPQTWVTFRTFPLAPAKTHMPRAS